MLFCCQVSLWFDLKYCKLLEPFNITIIQVYAPTSNTEEAEVEQFYEDLQDLLELTPQKDKNNFEERREIEK